MRKIKPSYSYNQFIKTIEHDLKEWEDEYSELRIDFFKNPNDNKIQRMSDLKLFISIAKSEIMIIKHWKMYSKFIQDILFKK